LIAAICARESNTSEEAVMKRSPYHLVVAWAATAAMVLGASSFSSAGHHGAHVVVPPGQAGPRVRPSSLNINDTICNPNWSTKTIRPPASYTNNLKQQQLSAARYVDKTPSHYEEDHLISLDLDGAEHPIQRTAWVNRPQSASASFANVATFHHKLVAREDKR
jgi:hypothetical protein